MTKLTTYTNPIESIERAFDSFFNLTPVFHSLEEVYRTGDTVRFSQGDDGLTVQIDIPGCKNEDLDLSVDSDTRDVYIKAKRTIKNHDSEKQQTLNRSFSVVGIMILKRSGLLMKTVCWKLLLLEEKKRNILKNIPFSYK